MAVNIRLKRMGTTKRPKWRVVVADSRSPRDGKFIEELGYYQPQQEPVAVNLNVERYQYWLSNGAQPSVAVKNIAKNFGV